MLSSQPDNERNPVLGIDLGTTYSAIARWDGQGPRPYEVDQGEKTLASVVYYDRNLHNGDEWLVGKTALNKGQMNPQNMATFVKRQMDDASHRFLLGTQQFSPIDLSAKLLENLYKDLVKRFHIESRGTVVTVPYYFEERQCENTREAAERANINFRELLREPIAASLSYTWGLVDNHPTWEGEEKILVFDLGGGTFDLTLFRLEQTPSRLIFEVLADDGHDKLGGIDFDDCLVDLLLEKSGLTLNDLSTDQKRRAQRQLLASAIEVKHALSLAQDEDVYETIFGQNIETNVTRTEFEKCIQDYTDKIALILQRLWTKTKVKPNQVDRIILVGGSSRIPCMRNLLEEQIGEGKVYESPSPDLCVAEGAAIYAAYLDKQPIFGGREVEISTQTRNPIQTKKNIIQELPHQLEDEKNLRSQLEIQLEPILGGITLSQYQDLHKSLENRNWREADKVTHRIMCHVAGVPQIRPCMNTEEIQNFPCEALRIIDLLWIKHSNGRFGFSVQKRIWDKPIVAPNKGAPFNRFNHFCDRVEWRVDGEWVKYKDLTFNLAAPEGHLPVVAACRTGFYGRCQSDISDLLSRL